MRFGGSERWDDPKFNSNRINEYNDWNDTSNRYRDRDRERAFDDDYDGEREDSDNESGNHNTAKRYRDADNALGSPDKKITVNAVNNAITNAKSPQKKPIKKIDLGAAANYARDASQSPIPKAASDSSNNNIDLFDNGDDFNPREQEAKTEPAPANDFGDFASAFGDSNGPRPTDEFADFSSAFNPPPMPTAVPQAFPQMVPPQPAVPQVTFVSVGRGTSDNFVALSSRRSRNRTRTSSPTWAAFPT